MAKNFDNVKTTSFLGERTDLDGVLTVKHGIRIDGRLSGKIQSASVVYLGKSAHITADITAEALITSGKVEGDVKARENVHVSLPGSIRGGIETQELVVEKGVFFDGYCRIKEAEPAKEL